MATQVTTSPVDNLIAGSFPLLVTNVTLLAGTVYKRGDVLEVNTDGKAIKVATAAKAKYILTSDCDATDGDIDALVYTTGQFHADECDLNGVTLADIEDVLHTRSIFLK